MIELVPTPNDAPGFLSLTARILNGAVLAHEVREVFLVHIDTWFDHKWLGWWSWKGNVLCVPPFTQRRVISERRFVRSAEPATWTSAALKRPLHIRQPGRVTLRRPLDRFSQDAAFVWYSGSTTTNTLGSLMFYRSGSERFAWYASIGKKTNWAVVETCRISPGELRWFEDRGRQLETAEAGRQ
jgi:hypothetical protein